MINLSSNPLIVSYVLYQLCNTKHRPRSDIADNILSAIRTLLQNAFLEARLPTITEEEEEEEGRNEARGEEEGEDQVDQEDVRIIEALPQKMEVKAPVVGCTTHTSCTLSKLGDINVRSIVHRLPY